MRTPGISSSRAITRSVVRRTPSTDAPGFAIQCMRKSFSANWGRNAVSSATSEPSDSSVAIALASEPQPFETMTS